MLTLRRWLLRDVPPHRLRLRDRPVIGAALLSGADPTKVGVETAGRLLLLAKEMGIEVRRPVLLVNGVRSVVHPAVQEEMDRLGVDKVLHAPFSDEVLNFSIEGLGVWELSEADHAYKALVAALGDLL